jgi:hypothetical protein
MEFDFYKCCRRISLLLFFCVSASVFQMDGQKKEISGQKNGSASEKQDVLKAIKNSYVEYASESPDTNFTYEKYNDFLLKVSDTSKYLVLPIDSFRKSIDSTKIVIGLRHDVDLDLNKAVLFSEVEKALGFRSTYYILHTADYYLANAENKAIHNEKILPVLKYMQEGGFEIGWHNDLVTLQVVYNIDPVEFLKQELNWLRTNGIKITGSASHGSQYCGIYRYVNLYFFNECSEPPWGKGIYVNNKTIPLGSGTVTIKKGNFSDFNLDYEAYFLNNNKYVSDASFINGRRWDIGMLDLKSLKRGDRIIILIHPIHWHKGSVLAEIHDFNIPGQESCVVNPLDSTVSVIMSGGYNIKNLTPSFALSPGAYAKCSGSLQTSGSSHNDFSKPVIYKVYSESRRYIKEWTVKVSQEKGSAHSGSLGNPLLQVFPNPSTGKVAISLQNITSSESFIEITNYLGKRIYSETVRETGMFTREVDLSGHTPGINFVKCSSVKHPVIFVLAKN